MKTKLIVLLFTFAITTGCASTSDQAAKDFLDGVASSAENRQKEESQSAYGKKRDYKNEAIEDTMSGVLTALFRGIFSSERNNDN